MTTATQDILAQMLTENTGVHLLDSGGAYGRNWERNQGRTTEDYLSEPPATIDKWGEVTLSVFHWLDDRVEYDPYWDHVFRAWTELDDPDHDTPWLESMERFAARVTSGNPDGSIACEFGGTTNSYNSEDSLSQVIQFTLFQVPEDHYRDAGEYIALVQIHGGCDVRGGYTAPRAFRVPGGYDGVYDMFDFDVYTLVCTAKNAGTPLPGMPDAEPHILDRRGEWISYDGSYIPDPWEGKDFPAENENGDTFIPCPWCGAPMEAVPYPVG